MKSDAAPETQFGVRSKECWHGGKSKRQRIPSKPTMGTQPKSDQVRRQNEFRKIHRPSFEKARNRCYNRGEGDESAAVNPTR